MTTPTGLALLRDLERLNLLRRRVLGELMRRPDDVEVRQRYRTQQSKLVALRTALKGQS